MSEHENRAPRAVVGNIEAVARLREAAARQRSGADRIADAIADFAGTIAFVLLHLVWFVLWAVVNVGLIPGVPPFDPYPFQLLTMMVSMEGVLLATFVLIKQNRMTQMTDQRDHLDLQINLLSERETTKIIQMLARISAHFGIAEQVVDAETEELAETTAIEGVARTVEKKLGDE